MIRVTTKGDWDKTMKFLEKGKSLDINPQLDNYGKIGVEALASATPKDTGRTSEAWDYEIHRSGKTVKIIWTNNNTNDGIPIAVLIQYGHGTGTGGYVQGRDYINPAIRPVFDQIAESIWEEVTKG